MSVSIFFLFSLANFSRLCIFPLPQSLEGDWINKFVRLHPFETGSFEEKTKMKSNAHTPSEVAQTAIASRCASEKF